MSKGSNLDISLNQYRYDPNGNVIRDYGRSISYTSFNKPKQIIGTAGLFDNDDPLKNMPATVMTQQEILAYNLARLDSDKNSADSTTIDFVYDGEHKRYKMLTPSSTTFYLSARYDVGTHFERGTQLDSDTTRDIHYVYAGGQMIGTVTLSDNKPRETHYFHKDHLGLISVRLFIDQLHLF